MAKKKNVKKRTRPRRSGGRTMAQKKARAGKKRAPKRPAAKKKAAKKKPAGKKRGARRRATLTSGIGPGALRPASGRQAGDLQGLSTLEGADSESVSELMDEGNAFEAGVVSGVERAGRGEEEVRTREVPEDDVPEEYLNDD